MNNEKIVRICIDDFAFKKRESYGTLMINIDNHQIVDILDSRELENVTEWLEKYPNIQVVSRDGSLTYNNAIAKTHPEAVQVSDRFHLLKNLTDYCKDFLMKYFSSKIIIETNSVKKVAFKEKGLQLPNCLLTLEAKMEKANKLLQDGLNKHQICQQLSLEFPLLNKLRKMTEYERVMYFKNSRQIKHEEKTAHKRLLIDEVIKLHNMGHSMCKIAKDLDISRHTVAKYLENDVDAARGTYGTKRKSILDPYLDKINALLYRGYTCNKIE
ncbi:transposase [Pectinatus sottacetonis]